MRLTNVDVIEYDIFKLLFNKTSQSGKKVREFCYPLYKIKFILTQKNTSQIIIIIIILGQASKLKKYSVYLWQNNNKLAVRRRLLLCTYFPSFSITLPQAIRISPIPVAISCVKFCFKLYLHCIWNNGAHQTQFWPIFFFFIVAPCILMYVEFTHQYMHIY